MTTQLDPPELESDLEGLHRLHSGKVRDIYAVGEHHLLLVATDRVSAFDVILPQRLRDKGKVLTSLSRYWFDETDELLRNHLVETSIHVMPPEVQAYADLLRGRSMLVHRCQPLKAEFVVRGYLAGSGWEEYQRSGSVCGHQLPAGLVESQKLPAPILTPTTKAPAGKHDEHLTIAGLAHLVGAQLASRAGAIALALYEHAAMVAEAKGIILADTKIEFGLHRDRLMIIDELFTPDSSRYWSMADYEPGRSQDSFDKQIIRDALLATGWDRTPPAPELDQAVLDKTRDRYLEIHRLITGRDLD